MKNMETSLDLHSLQQRLALVCSCLFVLPVLSCFTYVLYFVILPCYAMLYQNGVLKFSELSWKQPHILFVPCHPHRPVGQRHLTKRFRHAIWKLQPNKEFVILSGSKCSNKEELPQPQIWNRLQSALQRICDMWFEKFGKSSPFSGRPLCSWSETDQTECCCTKAPSAPMAIWMSLAGWVGDCYGSGAVLTSSRRPCRKRHDAKMIYKDYMKVMKALNAS